MRKRIPLLLTSDSRGNISDQPSLEAVGMKGGLFFRLAPEELIPLPPGSELFRLPKRSPVGYDPANRRFVTLNNFNAVAAFISPGYTNTYTSAYKQRKNAPQLPLFLTGQSPFIKANFMLPQSA